MSPGAEQLVPTGGSQCNHAENEGKLRRLRSRKAQRDRNHDGCAGTRGARKHCCHQLRYAARDCDTPRNAAIAGPLLLPVLDPENNETTDQRGPCDRSDSLRQLKIHLVEGDPTGGGNQKSGRQLHQVVAFAGIGVESDISEAVSRLANEVAKRIGTPSGGTVDRLGQRSSVYVHR